MSPLRFSTSIYSAHKACSVLVFNHLLTSRRCCIQMKNFTLLSQLIFANQHFGLLNQVFVSLISISQSSLDKWMAQVLNFFLSLFIQVLSALSMGLDLTTPSQPAARKLLHFLKMFIFERERQIVGAGEGQRERHTQNPKQAPGSELLVQSFTQGSNS